MIWNIIVKNCEQLVNKKKNLEQKLADQNIINNPIEYKEIVKEYNKIVEIVSLYDNLVTVKQKIELLNSEKQDVTDAEYELLINEELENLNKEYSQLEQKILELLLPEDQQQHRNIILEIRAGTGGEEAALFAADLLRMYTKFCTKKGWKIEILDINQTGLRGIKEVVCYVSGKDVYKYMKYESGVHRVQRVPETESSGRIHTSAATVAVLPEAEEVEVEVNPDDIEIETFRASGHGGQHLQKTDSAVRIKHKPTGIVVQCQDERSQIKNRERAMKILRAKLYNLKLQEQQREIAELRKSQVKSGDRSEKIRTYNFIQNRVTDHRINLTLYNLSEILDGELDTIINELMQVELKEKLSKLFKE
ncbi:MAG: peptide chain release factor 1 [Endomicrobia bacterium]|nr:peptide chain release factor 1 [Endomicrobiia bacterium]MCX7940561.1 peptide chain release factor 1 [Endomicrobiia bacterium]MDW8056046.1 peptide chain release factor 1 [Elusimicrobiota bacterium]